MNNEQIQTEIKGLKVFIKKIETFGKSKMNASSIRTEIEMFLHTLSIEFPLTAKYYIRNLSNEINITDGLKALKIYEKSKLKKKDDHYFIDGKESIKRGLSGMINDLEARALL